MENQTEVGENRMGPVLICNSYVIIVDTAVYRRRNTLRRRAAYTFGLTENDGHENDGHEIDGHEIDGPSVQA